MIPICPHGRTCGKEPGFWLPCAALPAQLLLSSEDPRLCGPPNLYGLRSTHTRGQQNLVILTSLVANFTNARLSDRRRFALDLDRSMSRQSHSASIARACHQDTSGRAYYTSRPIPPLPFPPLSFHTCTRLPGSFPFPYHAILHFLSLPSP